MKAPTESQEEVQPPLKHKAVNFSITVVLLAAVMVICMYSDIVLLAGAFTKVTNYDYFKTSFPLVMVSFSLSVILYVILGFLIT